MTREFVLKTGTRERVPLLIGLSGPSGGGKTYTALELATGIAEIEPGPIIFIDTENRRALHYADQFSFDHIDMQAPFGSLDYLDALRFAASHKPACIIVDSMSHEHEGPGGMIDLQEKTVMQMVDRAKQRGDKRQDWQLQDSYNMLAWREPKANRRALLNGILQLNTNMIFCWRANEKSKPTKKGNKTEIVAQGFTPIGAPAFIWEMTVAGVLLPGAEGRPIWKSDKPGEDTATKMAKQFTQLLGGGEQLSRKHGRAMAEWAKGSGDAGARPEALDVDALIAEGNHAASVGTPALEAFWRRIGPKAQAAVQDKKAGWKKTADETDKANAVEST